MPTKAKVGDNLLDVVIENDLDLDGYGLFIFICNTVIFLSFRTDRSGTTVQTQKSSLIRVYTVCNSLCIFWMHYFKEKPSC